MSIQTLDLLLNILFHGCVDESCRPVSCICVKWEKRNAEREKPSKDVIWHHTEFESNLNVCSIREIETLLYPAGGKEQRHWFMWRFKKNPPFNEVNRRIHYKYWLRWWTSLVLFPVRLCGALSSQPANRTNIRSCAWRWVVLNKRKILVTFSMFIYKRAREREKKKEERGG